MDFIISSTDWQPMLRGEAMKWLQNPQPLGLDLRDFQKYEIWRKKLFEFTSILCSQKTIVATVFASIILDIYSPMMSYVITHILPYLSHQTSAEAHPTTTFSWNNDPVAPRISGGEISALYNGRAKQLMPTPQPVMKRPR